VPVTYLNATATDTLVIPITITAAAATYTVTSNDAAALYWGCSANAATVTWTDAHTYTVPARVLTPAEVEAERVRIAAVKEAEDTARGRAEDLLNRYLREDQRATLKERGWFLVEGKSGARYRIYRGRSHNVKLLDAGDREVASLCAHPQMVVPEADTMLSQKLMLELAEDRFLAIANKRHLVSGIREARRIAA
jgi:hypothetical protein